MPKHIARLISEGVPIGTKVMYNLVTGEPYAKFNGLKVHQAFDIAQYLLSITVNERKELLERMLTKTKPCQWQKILDCYQLCVKDLLAKNEYRIRAGPTALVIDEHGVLH